MSAPLRLMLLRHAPVAGLAPGVCYGALDLPADPEATAAAARAVASRLPPGTPVWTSSRQRTRALGAALAALRPDLPAPRADARLDELNFGRWEGRPWDAIDRAAFDAWMADFADHAVGGGECVRELLTRVAAALASLARGLAERPSPRKDSADATPDALWITHAGVIRAVRLLQREPGCRAPLLHQWPDEIVPPGAWCVLELPFPAFD